MQNDDVHHLVDPILMVFKYEEQRPISIILEFLAHIMDKRVASLSSHLRLLTVQEFLFCICNSQENTNNKNGNS